MSDTSLHIPVMLDEVICALAPADTGLFIDATFGNGGYSRAILSSASCSVAAIDRDPDAILRGQELNDAAHGRLSLFEGPFSQMAEMMENTPFAKVDGIVFDLGVCSTQLDQPERGFSFRQDGPLDMRMSKDGTYAAHIVNHFGEADIANILWRYGDERASRRIARAIVQARLNAPIERTAQLTNIIHSVMPRPKPGQADSATRSFQALRIYVNAELEEIEAALIAAEKLLKPGGILAVVSFHSLEDRIVKLFLADRSGAKARPSRHLPDVGNEAPPTFTLTPRKPIPPTDAEIGINPRSRSAKLRVAQRTNAPALLQEVA